MFYQSLLRVFVPLFVTIDAFGVLPIFVSLTIGMTPQQRRYVTFESVGVAFLVAMVFMFLGDALFSFLRITETDFKIAGGILLLVLAILDLLTRGKPAVDEGQAVGIVPLAFPLIAGPATLTTTLVLAHSHGYAATTMGLALNFSLLLFVLMISTKIVHVVGLNMLTAFSKLVMVLLAAIAVNFIRVGITDVVMETMRRAR